MWGTGEDTFLIEDVQQFIKVLPVYFKTKNFASFVRQLNMYGFHKIKNDRGVHEFKHPQFKKDHYEELAHIKRKNILIGKEDEIEDKELDAEEFVKLKEKLDNTKVSLEAVTQQNMSLISANKEVAGQLYNFKQDYENRLSKFFFMFYFIVNSKSDAILKLLKKTLMDLGISYEDDPTKTIEERTKEAAEYITNQVLINSNCDHTIMNKLINAFTFFVNVGGYGSEELYYPEEFLNRMNTRGGYEDAGYDFRPYGHTFLSSDRSQGDLKSPIEEKEGIGSIKIDKIEGSCKLENDDFSSLNDFVVDSIYADESDILIKDYDLNEFRECN